MEESQFQQQQIQCPNSTKIPQSASNGPEIPNYQESTNLDLHSKLLHQQSGEIREEETSLSRCINGELRSNTEVGAEDDAFGKGNGEAATLPDPLEMAIPALRTTNSEINVEVGVSAKVKEDLSEGSSVEDNASEMGKTRGALPVANRARNPRSCGRVFHRRSLFVAKPPTLMAVVFPWDREREASISKNDGQAKVIGVQLFMVEGVTAMKKLLA